MYEVELVALTVAEEPVHPFGWTSGRDEDVIIVEDWLTCLDDVRAGIDALRSDVVVPVSFGMPTCHA